MTKLMVSASVATMLGVAMVGAAQGVTQDKSKNEKPVTLSGCVKAGIAPDTFMLMNVAEVMGNDRSQAVPTDARGRDVLYWLSSTKGLKVEAGQRVEVTGTLDLDNVDTGETKVTLESTNLLKPTTEIRSEGKKVTVETDAQPPAAAPAGTSGTLEPSPKETTKRVVYRLTVKSVRGIEGTCQ